MVLILPFSVRCIIFLLCSLLWFKYSWNSYQDCKSTQRNKDNQYKILILFGKLGITKKKKSCPKRGNKDHLRFILKILKSMNIQKDEIQLTDNIVKLSVCDFPGHCKLG